MKPRASSDRAALEHRLLDWIADNTPPSAPVTLDTEIVESGLFDSLALVSLVEWVEHEIGHALDPAAFDLTAEWQRVCDIVSFVERQRVERRSPGT